MASTKDLLSTKHFIGIFDLVLSISINYFYICTAASITSFNANVSAARVDLTTLFSFLDYHEITLDFPVLSTKNTRYPPCDPPLYKFPKDASL